MKDVLWELIECKIGWSIEDASRLIVTIPIWRLKPLSGSFPMDVAIIGEPRISCVKFSTLSLSLSYAQYLLLLPLSCSFPVDVAILVNHVYLVSNSLLSLSLSLSYAWYLLLLHASLLLLNNSSNFLNNWYQSRVLLVAIISKGGYSLLSGSDGRGR